MAGVLVTGGASGIGRAIADKFLEAGDSVYICDASGEALERCLNEQPAFRGSLADVGDPVQVEAAVAAARLEIGGIDVLVNNAGIAGPRGEIEQIAIDEFDRTLRINIGSMFYMSQQVVAEMKQRRSGSIINISSSSARTGLPGRTPYVVSKSAVFGLTLNLARELGPFGIRCNCIVPGAVANERGRAVVAAMAEQRGISFDAMETEVLSHISMRSWVQPQEVAAMCVFLASDACGHVSGQAIGVCGNVEWEG